MIEKMTIQHIQAVQHVAAISWHATYEGIIPKDVQKAFLQRAYSTQHLMHRLEHSHMYVAVEKGDIIGFANFLPVRADKKVELAALYMLPSKQGQKIGTKLLEFGIQQLKPDAIFAHVERENLIGRQFYIAKGFQMTAEFTEDFAGHSLQSITYEKRLV